MYCIKCGKQNNPDFAFCYNCGTRLVPPVPAPETSAETENTNKPPIQQAPLPPYGLPNPNQPNPNWQSPAFRYDTIPNSQQPFKMPTAPNGQPYVVAQAPQAFHSYKDKEGKQVYAAFAPIRLRVFASVIDFLVLIIPQQIISFIVLFNFYPDLVRRLYAAGGRTTTELTEEIGRIIPVWGLLIIYTLHLLYCTLMTSQAGGQTLGKKIFKIKVINLEGGTPDFQRSLRRNMFGYCWWLGNLFSFIGGFGQVVGFFMICLVFLGFNFGLFDPKRRGWHDRLADTVVVYKNELVQGVNY